MLYASLRRRYKQCFTWPPYFYGPYIECYGPALGPLALCIPRHIQTAIAAEGSVVIPKTNRELCLPPDVAVEREIIGVYLTIRRGISVLVWVLVEVDLV